MALGLPLAHNEKWKSWTVKNISLKNAKDYYFTSIDSMFSGCNSLLNLYIDGINTLQVDNMEKLFYNCNNLITIDLSLFYTEKKVNMN